MYNIDQSLAASQNHKAVSSAKGLHRVILGSLRKICEKHSDWADRLPGLLLSLHSSVITSTGLSPSFMLLHRELRIPITSFIQRRNGLWMCPYGRHLSHQTVDGESRMSSRRALQRHMVLCHQVVLRAIPQPDGSELNKWIVPTPEELKLQVARFYHPRPHGPEAMHPYPSVIPGQLPEDSRPFPAPSCLFPPNHLRLGHSNLFSPSVCPSVPQRPPSLLSIPTRPPASRQVPSVLAIHTHPVYMMPPHPFPSRSMDSTLQFYSMY